MLSYADYPDKGKYYCKINETKPDVCKQYHGKRRGKGIIFYVPDICSLR
jgi:hypothetical protein